MGVKVKKEVEKKEVVVGLKVRKGGEKKKKRESRKEEGKERKKE